MNRTPEAIWADIAAAWNEIVNVFNTESKKYED